LVDCFDCIDDGQDRNGSAGLGRRRYCSSDKGMGRKWTRCIMDQNQIGTVDFQRFQTRANRGLSGGASEYRR